jgi:hypothetical protein
MLDTCTSATVFKSALTGMAFFLTNVPLIDSPFCIICFSYTHKAHYMFLWGGAGGGGVFTNFYKYWSTGCNCSLILSSLFLIQ